jgi:hypothetical protein
LLVGEEEEQAQELGMDTMASPCSNTHFLLPCLLEEAGEKEIRVVLPPTSSLCCGTLPRRAECSSSSGTDWVR